MILLVIALASHATGEEENANPEKRDKQVLLACLIIYILWLLTFYYEFEI